LNGKCPACRRDYQDAPVEFKPVSAQDQKRLVSEKKLREKEKKEMEAINRKHLANMRVVQKNLVYVIGLSARIATEEMLRQTEFFGQYGRILKVVVNRKTMGNYNQVQNQSVVGVYVTFSKKDEAARCIQAIDGSSYEGRVLRATYGTTKYCSFYLRGLVCQNPGCMYLHEPGEEADSFTKEEMIHGRHHGKGFAANSSGNDTNQVLPSVPAGISDDRTPNTSIIDESDIPASPSALPRTAAWASAQGKRKASVTDAKVSSVSPAQTSLSTYALSPTNAMECSIFDEIYPYPMDDPIKTNMLLKEEDNENKVNLAPLHRHFVLARQTSEYYHQLIMISEQQHGTPSSVDGKIFALKPFALSSNQQDEKGSRFQFAKYEDDLTQRLHGTVLS
jgi:hypothetical protein